MRIYLPDRHRQGGARAYAEMCRELWGARGLLARLIRRDILLNFKVTFLGPFWSMAQSLLWLVIFVFLRRVKLFEGGGDGPPYVLFAFVGLLHWQLFAGMITKSSNSLLSARNLVTKVRFPREVIVFAACSQALFDYICSLPLLAALSWWSGFSLPWTCFLAPLALVPFFLLGAALALFAAAVALPIRDVVFGLPLILTPAMFISPVLYPLPGEGMWLLVGALNPVAPMLTVLRALFLGTAWPAPSLLLLWSALALLLFVIAWRFFDYLVPRVTEFA